MGRTCSTIWGEEDIGGKARRKGTTKKTGTQVFRQYYEYNKIDLSEHGTESSGSINAGRFLSSCRIGGFSRTAQLKMMTMMMIKDCSCAQA
jgi:hypothetical protein